MTELHFTKKRISGFALGALSRFPEIRKPASGDGRFAFK